jgi:hypothetical protein
LDAWSLFSIYRRILFLAVFVYALVRLASFVWTWVVATAGDGREERLLRRYALTLLLRGRFRRFWVELIQVGVLGLILLAILARHG